VFRAAFYTRGCVPSYADLIVNAVDIVFRGVFIRENLSTVDCVLYIRC